MKWCKVIIYVLFYKKVLILTVFTLFLILDKIQEGGQDGDHVWWRHRPSAASPPIKYTSSCREDQRLSTEGKVVSKNRNISKIQRGGGGSINPLPPLYHDGVWLCVYVRGLIKNERESVKPIFLIELVPKFHWIVQSSPLWWHSSATAIRSKGTNY